MSIYQLKHVQKVPIPLDEAWDFFSSPSNLKVITPDHMGFEIKTGIEIALSGSKWL